MNDSIDYYLSGHALYGDNFNLNQIAEWYEDEKEGYANLGAKIAASYQYGYHAWNNFHAYRHLPTQHFSHVLGFGSAYGDELLPIITKIGSITIVDPSEAFVRSHIHDVAASYVKPAVTGALPLPSDTFDLATCFGVLHHIPNVSFVIQEIVRTLKPGGYLALREPIVSMGDWTKPRHGLTKRERGIPLHLLHHMFRSCGLTVTHQALCAFPVTSRLFRGLKSGVYNNALATRVDALLAAAFSWNVHYHSTSLWQKLCPTSAFFLLRKPQR